MTADAPDHFADPLWMRDHRALSIRAFMLTGRAGLLLHAIDTTRDGAEARGHAGCQLLADLIRDTLDDMRAEIDGPAPDDPPGWRQAMLRHMSSATPYRPDLGVDWRAAIDRYPPARGERR